ERGASPYAEVDRQLRLPAALRADRRLRPPHTARHARRDRIRLARRHGGARALAGGDRPDADHSAVPPRYAERARITAKIAKERFQNLWQDCVQNNTTLRSLR